MTNSRPYDNDYKPEDEKLSPCQQGRDAFRDGLPKECNPYVGITFLGREWLEGYREAQEDEPMQNG